MESVNFVANRNNKFGIYEKKIRASRHPTRYQPSAAVIAD